MLSVMQRYTCKCECFYCNLRSIICQQKLTYRLNRGVSEKENTETARCKILLEL